MPNKKLNEWLKTIREPSGKLSNILAQICESDDLGPEEITKEFFLSQKGAGIRSWGEFVGLKKGLDHKLLYNTNYERNYPEIQTGQQWEIKGEAYVLSDIFITEIESPVKFKALALFKSTLPNSSNPFFEEEVRTILMEPETYKPYNDKSGKVSNRGQLPTRIFYTVGKSNRLKWFDISKTLAYFRKLKDGKNYLELHYPFKACFGRFISKRIKGINPLSDDQYGTLEEYFKKKYG